MLVTAPGTEAPPAALQAAGRRKFATHSNNNELMTAFSSWLRCSVGSGASDTSALGHDTQGRAVLVVERACSVYAVETLQYTPDIA